MKAMCIDDNWNKGNWPTSDGPVFGEIVGIMHRSGNHYKLAGYSETWPFPLWEVENFAPLSEIEETKINNTLKELT